MADEDADYHTVFENRIRFAETDAQGVVFFGSYSIYLDETFLAFLRELDHPYEDFDTVPWTLRVAHQELDYHAEATYGDTLTNAMRVERIGTSSLEFAYRAHNQHDELVATGALVHVVIDEDGPRPVPDSLREAIAALQTVPPATD